MIFGLIIGAALCVLPFFAADNWHPKGKKYKGDGGNFILGLILENKQTRMSFSTLKSLITVSKHVAKYTQQRFLQARRGSLDAYLQIMGGPLFKKENVTYSADRLSALFVTFRVPGWLAPIRKYDLNMFLVTVARKNGKCCVEKYQSYVHAKDFMSKPECVHNVFCFGYTIQNNIPGECKVIDAMLRQTKMIYQDPSNGKMVAHPFVSVTHLTKQERAALGVYFLREHIPWDQVIELSTKSQYKLFNLFVCYGTLDQLFKCIDFFCFTKFKKNGTQVQKTGPLLMSRAQEQWTTYDHKSCFFIESSEMSLFARATRKYIEQLKKENIFIKPEHEDSAPALEERLKRFEVFMSYLRHERIVFKKIKGKTLFVYKTSRYANVFEKIKENILLFFDTLSNKAYLVKTSDQSDISINSLTVESISEYELPDYVDHMSLKLNKEGQLVYKLKIDKQDKRNLFLKSESESDEFV